MPVNIDGPEGYEYQYLASAYLILKHITDESLSEAYIEKLNSEDLSMRLNHGLRLDVQFKKRKSLLDLDTFASCLVKFDPSSKSNNVLSKLIDKSLDSFFVLTDSKCGTFADDLAVLLRENSLTDRYSITADKASLENLLSALENVYVGQNKETEKARYKFVQEQVKAIRKNKDYSWLTDRVRILDRATKTFLIHQVNYLLGTIGIPSSFHELLHLKLLEAVTDGRSSGKEVCETFKKLVKTYALNLPVIDKEFKLVGDESELLKKLKQEYYILLTGISNCGKSQTAIYLSGELCNELNGVNYKITSDFIEAENFLLDNQNESRVCFLEDPFGQSYNPDNSYSYKRLENLINNLKVRNGKYLIATSKIELLDSLTNKVEIQNNWQNLTKKNRGFLKSLWNSITTDCSNETLINTVSIMLQYDSEQDLFQPGQLSYLVRNQDRFETITTQTVRHLANFDAKAIEQQIKTLSTEAVDIMLIMGICCDTISGADLVDLNYILSSGDSYFPGINSETFAIGTSIFGSEEEEEEDEPRILEYTNLPSIPIATSNAIEKILDFGYLLEDNKRFKFRHPIFEAGTMRLLDSGTNSIRLGKIFHYFRKAIGALNIKVASSSINSLYILTDYLLANGGYDERIDDIAQMGLKSTYLNVRISTLHFLVSYIEFLPKTLRQEAETKVRNGSYTHEDFRWQDNIAFIPNEAYWSDRSGFAGRTRNRLASQELWRVYLSTKKQLVPQDAYRALKFQTKYWRHQKAKVSINLDDLLPFFKYDELMIVEFAAYLLAASLTDSDFYNHPTIFFDPRPSVRYKLLKGLMRGWAYLKDQKVKNDSLSKMRTLLDNRFVALNALDFFTQFNSGHSHSSFNWENEIEDFSVEELWNLWAELSIILVSNLPPLININPGRFSDALAYEKVKDIEKKYEVIVTWLDWIDKRFKLYPGYQTSISDSMLFFFNLNIEHFSPSQRACIVKKAYVIEDADFHSELLRIITFNWHWFIDIEGDLLIRFSNELKFQKSVIITSKNCPRKVYEVLCDGNNLGDMTPQSIIEQTDPDIVMFALTSLYIHPQRLEVSYPGYDTWNPVLTTLCYQESHPGFRVSVRHYIWHMISYDRIGMANWPSVWEAGQMVKTFTESNIDFIFDCILDSIGYNLERSHRLIDIFFKRIPQHLGNKYGQIIEQNIEMISDGDNQEAIPESIYSQFVSPKIKADKTMMFLLDNSDYLKGESKNLEFITRTINHLISRNEIRIQPNILEIREWVRKNKSLFTEMEFTQVEEYLDNHFKLSDQQGKALDKKIEASFKKWLN